MEGALFAFGTASLLAFLHPYLSYPASLLLFARRPVRLDSGAPEPSAALVFCAYNEEKSLGDKLANVEALKQRRPALDVLAYSDMSTDRTLEMLEAHPDLLRAVPATQRTGKASGMRRLTSMIDADVVIFTDANVILDPESLKVLLAYFSDPAVGGVAGSLHYVNPGESTTAGVGSLYWRLEETIKRLESRSGSTMGADGSIFAVRRAFYPIVPAHLLDDLTVSMTMIFEGLRLVSAPDVHAYERGAASSGDEFRRKRRIACRAFNTHRHLWPKIRKLGALDVYKYVSHKLIRWFGVVWLGLAAVSFTLALALAGWGGLALAPGVVAAALVYLGLKLDLPVISPAAEVGRSIWATFLGVTDALRGRTYQTWTPATSR